jgi:O-antigen/teichoic acid export membrane protein
MMSQRTSANIVANLAGQGWTAVLSLLLIPAYVRLLGIEAYGLVGFFISLQYILLALDFGLAPTINRELARLTETRADPRIMRDMVRTLEGIYWMLGLGAGVAVVLAAPYIATSWVKAEGLPPSTVVQSIILMGLVSAFHVPTGLYRGGLLGLQQHVRLNLFLIVLATFRGVGALVALHMAGPSVIVFFTWHLLVGIVQLAGMMLLLWTQLPSSPERATFRLTILKSTWRFALGMSATAIAAIVLRQVDKIVLSRELTLSQFGYYMLAVTIGGSIAMIGAPISTALSPRLAALVASGAKEQLLRVYHRGSQVMSLAVMPVTLVAAMFAGELIWFWTGDGMTAGEVAPIARLLLIGTALNCIVSVPYVLQVAHGWTSLGMVSNVLAIVVLVPSTIIAVRLAGGIGGAAVWVVLNAGYLLLQVPFMHRRLLRDAMRDWYLVDVGRPLAATLLIVSLARWMLAPAPDVLGVGILAGVGLLATVAAALSLPQTLGTVRSVISMLRSAPKEAGGGV